MSKQQETAALAKMAMEQERGSYLEGLFTNDMVAWASQKIAQDFLPDLHAEYVAEMEQNQELRLEVSRLQSKVRSQKDSRNREEQAWKQGNENLQAELENAKAQSQRYLDQLSAVQTAKWEQAQELDAAEAKAEKLELELLKLKAKLFDLQNA